MAKSYYVTGPEFRTTFSLKLQHKREVFTLAGLNTTLEAYSLGAICGSCRGLPKRPCKT